MGTGVDSGEPGQRKGRPSERTSGLSGSGEGPSREGFDTSHSRSQSYVAPVLTLEGLRSDRYTVTESSRLLYFQSVSPERSTVERTRRGGDLTLGSVDTLDLNGGILKTVTPSYLSPPNRSSTRGTISVNEEGLVDTHEVTSLGGPLTSCHTSDVEETSFLRVVMPLSGAIGSGRGVKGRSVEPRRRGYSRFRSGSTPGKGSSVGGARPPLRHSPTPGKPSTETPVVSTVPGPRVSCLPVCQWRTFHRVDEPSSGHSGWRDDPTDTRSSGGDSHVCRSWGPCGPTRSSPSHCSHSYRSSPRPRSGSSTSTPAVGQSRSGTPQGGGARSR